jgi:hypothetical protein
MRLSHALQKQLHCVISIHKFTSSMEGSWVQDVPLNVESTHTINISSLHYITLQLQIMHTLHCRVLVLISERHCICVSQLWLILYGHVGFFFSCLLHRRRRHHHHHHHHMTVDPPGDSITNFILRAVDLEIPWRSIRKSEFPHWFSHSLRYCCQKNNYFCWWYRKIKTEYWYSKFFHYQKLVKITIKSDRLSWCKSICDDLKTQPTKFWSVYPYTMPRDVSGSFLLEPAEVAEAFTKHFQSVYNLFLQGCVTLVYCPVIFCSYLLFPN